MPEHQKAHGLTQDIAGENGGFSADHHDLSDRSDAHRESRKTGGQPMQVRRFMLGTLIAAGGVTLMLVVAFGLIQGVDERISMPVIAACMILGIMMLGGGFGVMATSAGTFDDDEFERLMAGERRRFDEEGMLMTTPPAITTSGSSTDEKATKPRKRPAETTPTLSC